MNDNAHAAVGATIKGLRAARGQGQDELADALGVSRPLVSAWETGRELPGRETLVSLARHFGMSVEELLGRAATVDDASPRWTILRPHRIRWAECDLYGHANHAAYLTMFEDLRVDHWQALSGAPIAPDRPGPVVAQLEVRYLRAVGFGDEVVLACRASGFRRTSFVHDYALLKDGQACCTARAVCVVTRQDSGEKVPLWPELRAKLLAEGAAEA